MTKKHSKAGQYFQADFDLIQQASQLGSFRLLASLLVLMRYTNGKPNTPQEKPFTQTYAGADAIRKALQCRWQDGRSLLVTLSQNNFISRCISQGKTAYTVHNHQLNIDLPIAIVDGANNADSALMRINGDKTLTEQEKLDTIIILLTIYKNLSMARFGGFNGVHQEWDITSDEELEGLPLCGISARNYKNGDTAQITSFSTSCKFINESLGLPINEGMTHETSRRFWDGIRALEKLGLIYGVIVLMKTNTANKQEFMFTIRVNDYHADKGADLSFIELVSDGEVAFYGTSAPIEEEIEYADFNDTEKEDKVIRLTLPKLPNKEEYQIFSFCRPRFRTSNADTGEWMTKERENLEATIKEIEKALWG